MNIPIRYANNSFTYLLVGVLAPTEEVGCLKMTGQTLTLYTDFNSRSVKLFQKFEYSSW